eukprot:6186371-Pleurochrysis_carterae.AAC.1
MDREKGVGAPQSKESRGLTTRKADLGSHGDAVTGEQAEELNGAGGVLCARGPVATVNAHRAGRLLERPRHC